MTTRAKLVIPKDKFIQLLKSRIKKGILIKEFIIDHKVATEKHRIDIETWNEINNDIFHNSFDTFPNDYTNGYRSDDDLLLKLVPSSWGWSEFYRIIEDKIDRLEKLIERADYMKEISSVADNVNLVSKTNQSEMESNDKRVFIVHGHDDAVKHHVARVISSFGLQPIILHEQPNAGLTILEKFERDANVDFAIVLLTADDLGGKSESTLRRRARQNVVFELGYFFGLLSRKRVMALVEDGVEKPSDIDGLVYCRIDTEGAWRFKVGQELKAAGFSIDLNKLH